MIHWFSAWILFGGFLAAVLAGGQLVRGGRGSRYLPALLASVAGWQCASGLYPVLVQHGQRPAAHLLHLGAITAYLWTGPLLYLYFTQGLAGDSEEGRRRSFWLFVPGLLAGASFIVYAVLRRSQWNDPDFLMPPQVILVGYASAILMVVYTLAVLYQFAGLWHSSASLPPEIRRAALLLAIPVGLLGLAEIFAPHDILNAFVTVMLILLYWTGNRHPAFLEILREEAERARYAQSRLRGLPVNDLAERLRSIMEAERLFQDDSLSLSGLAERLDLSAHQLSELINTRFDTNFYGFVNEYRVEYARQLLAERPELSVTAVGFEAGFNTNSVFYEAFRRKTGVSPGAFRKQIAARR